MDCLKAVENIVLTAPPTTEYYKEALLATASVAAVVWTGGLIVRQLKAPSITIANGLDFVQAAFMGPLVALATNGVPLRLAAIAFLVVYTIVAAYHIREGLLWRKQIRMVNPAIFHAGNAHDAKMYAKQTLAYGTWTLISMIAYIFVIWRPTPLTVFVVSWVMLFVGLQVILGRLYADG